MSVERDTTSNWQKHIYDLVQTHYDNSPLPKSSGGGFFGRSAFGFATQTFNLPGLSIGDYELGLSPTTIDDAIRIGRGEAANFIFGGLFRQDQLKFVNGRYNQLLERHGFLNFNFKSDDFALTLPFYENPKITESRTTEYSRNKIVNRSEPIRLWTGSNPAIYKVEFKLTLPHILEFAVNHASRDFESFKQNSKLDSYRGVSTESFTESGKQMGAPDKLVDELVPSSPEVPDDFIGPVPSTSPFPNVRGFAYKDPNVHQITPGQEHASVQLGTPSNAAQRGGRGTINYQPQSANPKEQHLIQYVIHMVDTIRACVIGSVKSAQTSKPQTGPPIVTLKFGSLYDNIPCIATNYDIKYDEVAGYHNYSMLPRRLTISITLESFNQSLLPGGDSRGGALEPSPGWNTIFKTDEVTGGTP